MYLWQLIIGWTCVGVFVCTAVITVLAIVGLLRIDRDIRNQLFAALVLEIVAIGVAVFAGLVKVDPKPVAQEITASVQAQQTLREIDTVVTANATPEGPQPTTPQPGAIASAEITPRVYIQIASDAQRDEGEKARDAIRDAGQLAPGIENVGTRAPNTNQLRYFLPGEAELAGQIEAELAAVGITAPATLINGFENADIRPHHFELWFGKPGN